MNSELALPPRSPLRRLFFTPMSDIVRGRLSGRLDLQTAMDESTLPPRIKELVRAIVQQSRLWRSERVDVARELLAHFEDGLAAGAEENELLSLFGDAAQAARLIRRAKIRNRPAAWKVWRAALRAGVGVFAILLIAYVVLAIRVFTASPTIARDHLAEINAGPLMLREEQRAWPLYREAALDIGVWPKFDDPDYSPNGRNWAQWREFAETQRAALAQIHIAARREHIGIVYGMEPDPELDQRKRIPGGRPPTAGAGAGRAPIVGVMLPQVAVLREAARLAAIDAHIGVVERDANRVAIDIETIFRISEQTSQMPFLISDLVSVAVASLGFELIESVFTRSPELLTDGHIAAIAHQIAALRGGSMAVSVSVERRFFDDVIQRLYTDDGNGDGRLVGDFMASLRAITHAFDPNPPPADRLQYLLAPAASAVVAGRREMVAKYEELMTLTEREAQTPLWKRGNSTVNRMLDEMHQSAWAQMRYPILVLLFPALSRAGATGEIAIMRRDTTLTILALELFRRRNGAYPATLAELSPKYLPNLPVDRGDGQPLRYRLIDGRPLLYSIGPDRDDDGGRAPAGENGNDAARRRMIDTGTPAADLPDGDWLLWPAPAATALPATSGH